MFVLVWKHLARVSKRRGRTGGEGGYYWSMAEVLEGRGSDYSSNVGRFL